jgi:hypothetical protein
MIKKTFQELDRSLSIYYNRNFREKTKSLRRLLLDSPTQYQDVFQHWDPTNIHIGTHNFKVLAGLAVMSWYMTEEIGILLRLQLEETEWPSEKYFQKELLLTSKDVMIGYLILQEEWSSSDFFGNVLNVARLRWNSEYVSFAKVSERPVKKYTGYCRGYQESNRRGFSLPRSLQPVDAEEADVQIWQVIKISTISYWKREIRYLLGQYEIAV